MARTLWETIEGNAGQILAQLRRIVDEGNARRVVVRQRGQDDRRVSTDRGGHWRGDCAGRGRHRRTERAHRRLHDRGRELRGRRRRRRAGGAAEPEVRL